METQIKVKKSHRQLLIYIDPGFLENLGHYMNFALNIRDEAKKRDVEMWHLVNLNVSDKIAGALNLERVFPFKAYVDEQDKNQQAVVFQTFTSVMQAILNRLIEPSYTDADISLFMYTSHPIYFYALTNILNDQKYAQFKLKAHLNLFYVNNIFCLGYPYREYETMLHRISSAMERYDPFHKIRLYSDSLRTINIYAPYFNRPLILLPLPLTKGFAESPQVQTLTTKQITIGFFGYAHQKQGYHLVTRLYKHFYGKTHYDHVKFIIRHLNHSVLGLSFNPEIRECHDYFRMQTKNVFHISEHFSQNDYEQLLTMPDVVLIPHSRQLYPVQTSGLFVDCLKKGKIVVVPADTWMADQLMEFGSGEMFESDNPASFISAVEKIVNNIDHYKKNANRKISQFCAFHSAKNLFDTLEIGTSCKKFHPIKMSPQSPLDENKSAVQEFALCANTCSISDKNSSQDRVEILSLEFLDKNRECADFVYREKKRLGSGLGWHYILDISWILKNICDLPRGSIVLDAGAGNGLLQFLLAELGFKVISVDFSPRTPPQICKQIWNIIPIDSGFDYDNEYIRHLKATYPGGHRSFQSSPDILTSEDLENILYTSDNSLIYYRCDFTDMRLIRDDWIDCVVSVSALEHNEHESVKKAVQEFLRVLKPQHKMLLTVSAALTRDWYHEPSKGWCYSEETLKRLFQLPHNTPSNFSQREAIFASLRKPNNELHRNLERFYFQSGNNGMPWGIWNPQYLPVGILKFKSGKIN